MQTITTIGLNIAKSVFQVHGIAAACQVAVRRRLKRRHVVRFFQKLPPCLVGIEARGFSDRVPVRSLCPPGFRVCAVPRSVMLLPRNHASLCESWWQLPRLQYLMRRRVQ